MIPRPGKRELLARTLEVSGCGRMLRSVSAWRGVLILNYHRIGEPNASPLDRHLFSATAADFEQQVAFLVRNFEVIGLSDLGTALRDSRGRFVMITFDDGYRDNFTTAFPILKSYGATATFFIATGFLDRPSVPWWDELAWMIRTTTRSCLPANEWLPNSMSLADADRKSAFARVLAIWKSMGTDLTGEFLSFLADELGTGRCPESLATDLWMTWDMLREMQSRGMSFGAHTVTHPILANATGDRQDWEISESRRRLEAELGRPIDAFSYPNGLSSSFNELTRAALRSHQFRWAFCHAGRYCAPGRNDAFALARSPIETDIDLPMFRAITTLPQLFS